MGVVHGAIAIIKVKGVAVGLMRSVNYQDNSRRQVVKGLGTIMPREMPVTDWSGTLNCDSMVVSLTKAGIPNVMPYNQKTVRSQVELGQPSFEDQLVLDENGVQIDLFRKVADAIDANGNIKPKLRPMAIIPKCMVTSNSFEVSEGNIMTKRQSFDCMEPIIELE